MKQAIGAYFRALREWRGLPQEEVARKLNVSSKQVYNWERGENLPPAPMIARLIALLGGTWDDLVPFLIADDDRIVEENQGQARARAWIEHHAVGMR
jgi:transcriptional regulator with XRE-family HTH domain